MKSFKIKIGTQPGIMRDFFHIVKPSYQLRNAMILKQLDLTSERLHSSY